MTEQQYFLSELKRKKPIRILFVCLGNICRSPAAQGVMQALIDERGLTDRFELDSAGLYGGHAGDLPDKRMRVHAFQRGYNLTHRSRPVRSSDFEQFDLIIGMDDSNISRLRALSPSVEDDKKIVRMTDFCRRHPNATYVPDPYYEGAEGFELVLDLLEDSCQGLLDELA
ncbi:MAG: low molecular weight phosphotyrosine protein phosphatase [Muribaculaceae bacterium]|nr:low molecular weight phosphotyrosine protein phosphatase [Muribaculaceae bacterium]